MEYKTQYPISLIAFFVSCFIVFPFLVFFCFPAFPVLFSRDTIFLSYPLKRKRNTALMCLLYSWIIFIFDGKLVSLPIGYNFPVPAFSSSSRMVFSCNFSYSHSLKYSWGLSATAPAAFMRIPYPILLQCRDTHRFLSRCTHSR